MLFLVVETFKPGRLKDVKDRFDREGRLLPEGVHFVDSWMTEDGAQCFQIMKAGNAQLLQAWLDRWTDLVDFEAFPIKTSADFWSNYSTS